MWTDLWLDCNAKMFETLKTRISVVSEWLWKGGGLSDDANRVPGREDVTMRWFWTRPAVLMITRFYVRGTTQVLLMKVMLWMEEQH